MPDAAEAVRNTYRGIVREIGSFQKGKATMRRVFLAFEGERGAAAACDRALLLLGLAGGYRVGELASLRVDDVELVDEGAIVMLRSSKTDQAGGGVYKKAYPTATMRRLARSRTSARGWSSYQPRRTAAPSSGAWTATET